MRWWLDWCSLCHLPQWAEPCAEIWDRKHHINYADSASSNSHLHDGSRVELCISLYMILYNMLNVAYSLGSWSRSQCKTFCGGFCGSKRIHQTRMHHPWMYQTCWYLAKVDSGKQSALKQHEMLRKGCIALGFLVSVQKDNSLATKCSHISQEFNIGPRPDYMVAAAEWWHYFRHSTSEISIPSITAPKHELELPASFFDNGKLKWVRYLSLWYTSYLESRTHRFITECISS